MRLILLISFATLYSCHVSATSLFKKSTGEAQVNLIELYTSQGCSSCPPAEKWLRNLKNHPQLWKTFIPLEFHVDYWNYLGWNDPFSNSNYTQRQKNYSQEWGSSVIYTPGFVLNGKEWKERRENNFTKLGKKKIGTLKVIQLNEKEFLIRFIPSTNSKPTLKKMRAYGVLMGNNLSRNVTRGENAGRKLSHHFVVLDFQENTMFLTKKGFEITFSLRAPSTIKLPKNSSQSVAFWVTTLDSIVPLQALGGDL